MGQGELYEGIIRIRVDDDDAPARVQQILDEIRSRFATAFSSMPDIGAGLNGTGLGETVNTIDQIIGQMERLKAAMAEARGSLSGANPIGTAYLDAQLRDMDALLAKTRELQTLRERTGQSLALGTGADQVAAAEARAQQAIRERDAQRAQPTTPVTQQGNAAAAAGAGAEAINSSVEGLTKHFESAEGLTAALESANKGAEKAAKIKEAAESREGNTASEAAKSTDTITSRLDNLAARMRRGATDVDALANALFGLSQNVNSNIHGITKQQAQIAAARAFDVPPATGSGGMTANGRYKADPKEIDRLLGIPHDEAAVDKVTLARDAEATAAKRYTHVLEQGSKTQEDADLQAMQARKALRTATAKRADAELKAATSAEKEAIAEEALARKQAAKAQILDSPHLQAAGKGDAAAILGAYGVDKEASLKRQQLQLDQAILERKAITLQEASRVAQDEGDIAKLTKLAEDQAKLRLQIQAKIAQQQELTATEARNGRGTGGFIGGLTGNYGSGTRNGMADLANQAGFALKYYAFYQVFAQGQRALSDIINNTREYSLAVNQLSIDLGTNYTQAEKVAQGYADIGNQLATAPAQAVNSAVQFQRAFANEPKAEAGRAGAKVGSLVNLLEGGDPEDQQKLMEDLVAIAENYKTGASGVSGIYDSATSIAQSYQYAKGGDLLSGFAQIADLTSESGYTKEQGLALIASVMQRTGGSSDVAAGDLKRFLGRSGQKSFQDVFSQFGISRNQTLREQLGELSEKFDQLNESQRNTIISRLGGGRAGAAVAAGILDYVKQQKASEKALKDQGIASKQAEDRLSTLGGKLQQIGADWAKLTTDIGKSGLGDAFGLALDAVHPLLTTLDDLINLIARAPEPVKELGSALLFLAGALKAVAIAKNTDMIGAVGMLGPKGRFGINGKSVFTRTVEGETARFAVNSAGMATDAAALGRMEKLSGGVKRLGTSAGAAAASLGPLLAVIGGMIAIGGLQQKKQDVQQITDQVGVDFKAMDKARTPEAKRAAAQALRQDATNFKKTGDGLWGHLGYAMLDYTPVGLLVGGPPDGAKSFSDARDQGVKMLRDRAKLLEQQAKAQQKQLEEAARKAQAGMTPTQDFFGSDYRRVSEGLADVMSRGVGTSGSTRLLSDLIKHSDAAPSGQLADLLQPGTGMTGIADLINGLQNNISQAGLGNRQATSQLGRLRALEKQLLDKAKQGGDTAQIAAAQQIMNEGEKAYWDQLVKNVQDKAAAVDQLNPVHAQSQLKSVLAADRKLLERAKREGNDAEIAQANQIVQQGARAYYDALIKNTLDRINSIKALHGENAQAKGQIKALVTKALAEVAAAGDVQGAIALINQVDKGFLSSFRANMRAQLQILKDQRAAIEQAMEAAAQIRSTVTETVDGMPFRHGTNAPGSYQLGKNRAKLDAKIKDKIKQLGKINDTLDTAIPLSAPSGDFLKWPKDSGSSGPTPEDIALARMESQKQPGNSVQQASISLQQARYKLDHAKDQQEYYNALGELHQAQFDYGQAVLQRTVAQINAGKRPGDSVQQAAVSLQAARRQLAGASADDRYDAAQQVTQALFDLEQARVQRITARMQSNEIASDPLSQARVALQVAREKLSHASPDDYYSSLRELHQAQYDLANAELDRANSADLLRIDITDPVAQAREKVRVALRKLRLDQRRGALSDVTTKDEADLRQARSDAEKSAWDQHFSDVQTNYQLQRISLGAYLSYLHSQHDLLTNVKHKTRQQVEELNQVDQALKAAAQSMNSQFNLGSIKLPTVYEVRRAIEQRAGLRDEHNAPIRARAMDKAGPQQVINFQIDGADTGYILSLFTKYIGQPALGSVTTTTRRN